MFSECSKHCSLCYNETECYECTQGYFLNEIQECESKFSKDMIVQLSPNQDICSNIINYNFDSNTK